ncbi:hypothetical protein X777_08340, partial [Ooceraea biroi]
RAGHCSFAYYGQNYEALRIQQLRKVILLFVVYDFDSVAQIARTITYKAIRLRRRR